MGDRTRYIMSREEEEEMEAMVRQRRSTRGTAFYGGSPPDFDSPPPLLKSPSNSIYSPLSVNNPTHSLSSWNSSGKCEPNSVKWSDRITSKSSRLRIGYADTIGKRPTMEDELVVIGNYRGRESDDFLAVYDGHGGRGACEWSALHLHRNLEECLIKFGGDIDRALRESFLETNEEIREKKVTGGTTALVALRLGEKLYIANAGDSRAVAYDGGKVIRLSTDHKPDLPEEEERVKALGGVVTKTMTRQGKTIGRVGGMLAVSRALGDLFLEPFVTAEPQITTIPFSQVQLLILACDGVWDVLSDEEAIEVALSTDDPEDAAIKLRDLALRKGSTDNITAAVIFTPSLSFPTSFSSLHSLPSSSSTTNPLTPSTRTDNGLLATVKPVVMFVALAFVLTSVYGISSFLGDS